MADIWKMKQGNLRPVLVATLTDAMGNAVNLSTATAVVLHMVSQEGSTKISAGACTVLDAPNGVVQYAWSGTDTNTADTYNAEFMVTFSDATEETFPGDVYFTVVISAALA